MPSYLPDALISDETVQTDSALANALRHENYTISSVEEACRTVLDDIESSRAHTSRLRRFFRRLAGAVRPFSGAPLRFRAAPVWWPVLLLAVAAPRLALA